MMRLIEIEDLLQDPAVTYLNVLFGDDLVVFQSNGLDGFDAQGAVPYQVQIDGDTYIIMDPRTLADRADALIEQIQAIAEPRRPRMALLSRRADTSTDLPPGTDIAATILSTPVRRGLLSALLAADATSQIAGNALRNQAGPGKDRPSRNLRVLLAEDNPVNQKVARGVLEMLGCTVSLAADGKQALELAQSADFDLIFMDCQMPEMDGYEAARKIRELTGAAAHVPIIALTANALSEVRQACLEAGMDDFLTKPVNRIQLDHMLDKWEPAACANC